MSNNEFDSVKQSLLTFPCDFPIKIFGEVSDSLESEVIKIIKKHVDHFPEERMQSRLSANGKYRALSITLHVTSQQQLDAIYQDLSSSPHVIMVL